MNNFNQDKLVSTLKQLMRESFDAHLDLMVEKEEVSLELDEAGDRIRFLERELAAAEREIERLKASQPATAPRFGAPPAAKFAPSSRPSNPFGPGNRFGTSAPVVKSTVEDDDIYLDDEDDYSDDDEV